MASNLLWAHLLRNDARTTTESPSQIPPLAPQDKTGTSMRMLIHDTQVNLEKFSARLDDLLQRVEDCRAQVVNANKLLDVERDKVLTEILEISNRCQSELKMHVGTPAQAPALDLVHVTQVSTEKSVQALEKRIDALQALLQTHAHAMQSIQDQQNTLIGTVLPLVPIVHGIPPQVDQLKVALSDVVANAASAITHNIEHVRSTLVAEFAHRHERAESSTRVAKMSAPRRKRSIASVHGRQEINAPVSSPLDDRGYRSPHANLKRPRGGATHHAGNAQLPRKLTRLEVPLMNPGDQSPLRTPQTPRRPLADIRLPLGSKTPKIQYRMASHITSASRGYMHPFETLPATEGPSILPTSIQPLEHARADLQDPAITRRRSAGLHDMPLARDKSMVSPSGAGPSDQDALSKRIKIEETLEANLNGVFSIRSTPLSSPPSSAPLARRRDPLETNANVTWRYVRQRSRPQANMPDAPRVELVPVPPAASNPFSPNADASPPKSMSLRDRRAQISRIGRTETRRFIPLVPWSDEDE